MRFKPSNKFLLLVSILILPSLIYVVLSTGKHEIIRLPYFGIISENDSNETAFKPIDLKSKGITANTELSNKITLVHIGLPADVNASGRIYGILNEVANKFTGKNDFLVLSILESSYADTKEYSEANKNLNLNKQIWFSSLANEELLQNLIVEFDVQSNEVWQSRKDKNLSMPVLCLLDKKGFVRAYFDGTQYTEKSAITDAMKIIKAEEFLSKKGKKK